MVKVQGRAFRSAGTIDQFSQIVGDGSFDIVSVGLTEQKASTWRWFEEFCRNQTAEYNDFGLSRSIVVWYEGRHYENQYELPVQNLLSDLETYET